MSHTMTDSEMSVSGGAFEDSDTNSSSSCSMSSSTSNSNVNDLQLDTLELAKIMNEVIRLPRGLCENMKIFHEFFSVETWNNIPEAIRSNLEKHLPHFTNILTPQETSVEIQRTLSMLFNGDLMRFGHSPLFDLQQELEGGNFRPDVLRLRQSIAKSRRREQRFQRCERLSQLAKELFLSRERLLRTAYKSAPSSILRTERITKREQTTFHADTKLCTVRCRKRFRKELDHITDQLGIKANELSADEADASTVENVTDESHFNMKSEISSVLKLPASGTDRLIFSTLFKKRKNLADEDAIRTDQNMQQSRLSNRNFRSYIREHKRRKITEPTLPDFETFDIRLRDVCARAQMGGNFKQLFGVGKVIGRKTKAKLVSFTDPPALVPITGNDQYADTSEKKENEVKLDIPSIGKSSKNLKEQQGERFQQRLSEHSNGTLQHPFLPEDGAPFNILDGEVELQQEEVETYGSCEEALPSFVIPNEVVLPTIEQTEVPPQKLLQTPHKEDDSNVDLQGKYSFVENISQSTLAEQNMPKLESIFSKINKTPVNEKTRSNSHLKYNATNISSAIGAVVTPIRRQTQPMISPGKSLIPTILSESSELIQETHACFFSLIRDLFCATPHHRMQYNELRMRIDIWLRNPITALNDWYAQSDNWSALLTSAINFLAGDFSDQSDEYVPYLEFKSQQNIFQWIGAGRDSDTRLSKLCLYWLQRREVSDRVPTAPSQVITDDRNEASNNIKINNTTYHSNEIDDAPISFDGGISPPPPPRCPTAWTVCAATPEEIIEFQRQERERFEQPHRAYTYHMNGYESVVGPVKGIYTQMYALTKARGHSMMIGNRPNFVTILTLVRDATARLPNGEGTRADIAELLKSSQYINLKEGENVLQTTVSGALDRMHTEHDPCVRYDPKRKIWIYLHRNRSEDDFERIHQQSQGVGKSKKVVHRKAKTKVALAKTTSEINDSNTGLITCEDEANVGTVNAANTTPKVSPAFSMPALVPTNPIIVSSQSAITQQKIPLVITKPSVNRSLPVPPLKYNIPHQQQKSLLKTTVQSQSQRHQEHRQINNITSIDTQVPQHQRVQQRMAILTKNTTVTEVSEESKVNKQSQLNLTMSPIKSNLATITSGNVNSTPIIVATPSGLQTVHVSSATVVTSSPGTSVSLPSQQSPSLSATFSGKKVALNKPIIINQIKGQSTLGVGSQTKSVSQQVLKQQNIVYAQQQQKQTQGFIIPISMSNSISNATDVEVQNLRTKETNLRTLPLSSITTGGSTTIYMDNTKLVSDVGSLPPEQAQQNKSHGKNIIRIVPSISGSGVKSILQPASTGSVVTSRKPPVHVIGHRVVTGGSGIGTARAHTQQTKSLGNISLMSSNSGTQTFGVSSMGSAASGSTLIKMSPHTFATLQHKQNQQIVVKKSSPSSPVTNQQHRVIDKSTLLKNSTVVPQSGDLTTQAIGKKVFMHHTSNVGIVHKSVVKGAASVGSQTSSTPSLAEKVHTINTTNLTSQQQRALLQNIKQQQQQQSIQLKSVQLVSSDSTSPQAQSQMNQVVSRAQTLAVLPSVATGDVVVGHQANNKALAVMVSQAQGLPRVLKVGSTTSQSQQQQQAMTISANDTPVGTTASGTRILTTSTGQIISLESLLQKQSSNVSLKTNPSGGVGAIVKNVHTASISQQPQLVTSTGNATTYTVVSQARNVNTHRPTTSQTSDGVNTSTKTTLVGGRTGRIIVSAGGQLTTPQLTKVLGKTGVTTNSLTTATTGGSIRLIKSTSNIGSVSNSFNVTSLQGKQVVFAAKPSTTVAKNMGNSSQAQQIHSAGVVIGGQTLKLQRNLQQNNIVNSTSANSSSNIGVAATQHGSQMQTVIMGNQILRVQQMQTAVKTVGSNGTAIQQRIGSLPVGNLVTGSTTSGRSGLNNGNETGSHATTMNLPKTVVLGSSGQTIRLQQSQQSVPMTHQLQPVSTQIQTQSQTQLVTVKNSSQQGVKTSNVGRVVLAVQGGGQIFLSPNFQGNTLNLKTLQNMKVVSLSSHIGTVASTSSQSEDKSTATSQKCGSSNS